MSDIFDLYDEFDEQFGSDDLRKDVEQAESGEGNGKEVPHNVYEVKITKLELVKSKTSSQPMLTCWFKIVAGDYTNQMIFMNQVINTTNANARGFQLHKCNEFLRSLKTSLPVNFESFKQYGRLIYDIMGEIEDKREFQLNYSKDTKGYSEYKIEKIFEMSGGNNVSSDDIPF